MEGVESSLTPSSVASMLSVFRNSLALAGKGDLILSIEVKEGRLAGNVVDAVFSDSQRRCEDVTGVRLTTVS